MYFTAVVLLLSLAGFSEQADSKQAKKAIEDAWEDADKRLRAIEPATWSILNEPIAKLNDLKKAGKKSVDLILSFQGPGDKDKAIDNAVVLWKAKMEEIIKPFVDRKDELKLLAVDYAGPMPEPDYERTEEYVNAEEEINAVREEAEKTLLAEHDRVTRKPPTTADEVAKAEWKKAAAKWPLKTTLGAIQTQSKSSLHDAGNGNHKEGMERLRRLIKDWSADFYKDMKAIEKE